MVGRLLQLNLRLFAAISNAANIEFFAPKFEIIVEVLLRMVIIVHLASKLN